MFNKEELLKEEMDCADMLGMTLEEYHEYISKAKINIQEDEKRDYDNKILEKLGLEVKDLKRKEK